MADKLPYIPNDDTQNYSFRRLQLVVETNKSKINSIPQSCLANKQENIVIQLFIQNYMAEFLQCVIYLHLLKNKWQKVLMYNPDFYLAPALGTFLSASKL